MNSKICKMHILLNYSSRIHSYMLGQNRKIPINSNSLFYRFRSKCMLYLPSREPRSLMYPKCLGPKAVTGGGISLVVRTEVIMHPQCVSLMKRLTIKGSVKLKSTCKLYFIHNIYCVIKEILIQLFPNILICKMRGMGSLVSNSFSSENLWSCSKVEAENTLGPWLRRYCIKPCLPFEVILNSASRYCVY